MKNIDKKRGSGRTTRLIAVAKYLARQGNKVVIVAANKNHRVLFYSQISNDFDIEVKSPDENGGFCWETMSFRDAPENTIFLVDHWAIESRFSKMLNMLTSFDNF